MASGAELDPLGESADGELRLPERIGPYPIRGVLGRGASGLVYRAYDPISQREVALKVIGASGKLTRFEREWRIAATLDHPNIVNVVRFDIDAQHAYMVMELVDGPTLAALIDGGHRFPMRRAVRFLTQVADAVDHAHGHEVLHRDLKPANILVQGPRQIPRVADFGIALVLDESQVSSDGDEAGTPGTPAYMAPEQIEGTDLDARSDVYSLGVILYELLTGVRPFRSRSVESLFYKILSDTPEAPHRVDPRVSPDLSAICLKAMARQPADRYPSARALVEELERWAVGRTIHARARGVYSLGSSLLSRHGTILLVVAAAALATVVIGLMLSS